MTGLTAEPLFTTTQQDRPTADQHGVIRVLVVDDSAVVRKIVVAALSADPDVEVAGTAANGVEAVDAVRRLLPDAVVLDVEMPVMDGLEALDRIRELQPRLPVIMFSTLTERGAATTLEALSRGASDYVTKPVGEANLQASTARIRTELVPRLKALAGVHRMLQARPLPDRGRAAVAAALPVPPVAVRPDIVVVGASTGGPDALTRMVQTLPRLDVPMLIVQHMPAVFTTMFAERLSRLTAQPVHEAAAGQLVLPGEILLAPGDFHLEVVREGAAVRTVLHQGPQENFCRPAVDVLFRSAAATYGERVLAVVLTGMGQDGLEGCRALVAGGAQVIAQDEETSAVWGMPGAVVRDGLVAQTLPLDAVGPRIVELTAAG